MKKFVSLCFTIVFWVMSFTACGDRPSEVSFETTTAETTTVATTATTLETTAADTTEKNVTTTETTATETTVVDTVETTTIEDENTESVTLETLPDMFVELMKFSEDRGYFYPKSDITRFSSEFPGDYICVHYRVIGNDSTFATQKYGSRWFVELIDVYGEERFDNIEIDYDKTYTWTVKATLESSQYGRPVPTIGEDYFRYIHLDEFLSGDWWLSLYMDIKEVDGEKYLYGYGIDISAFESAIEITNEEENQIYNEENHYKIIAYLNKIGKELPTFDYKIKMEDFLDELGIVKKD